MIFPPPLSCCGGDDGNRIPGEPSGPNASHVLREASLGRTFAAQLPDLLGLPFPAPPLSWGDRWKVRRGGLVPPSQGQEKTQARPLGIAPRQHIFWQVPGGFEPAHRMSVSPHSPHATQLRTKRDFEDVGSMDSATALCGVGFKFKIILTIIHRLWYH